MSKFTRRALIAALFVGPTTVGIKVDRPRESEGLSWAKDIIGDIDVYETARNWKERMGEQIIGACDCGLDHTVSFFTRDQLRLLVRREFDWSAHNDN